VPEAKCGHAQAIKQIINVFNEYGKASTARRAGWHVHVNPRRLHDARAASAHRGVRARVAAPVARGPTWCRRRDSRLRRSSASPQVGGRPPLSPCAAQHVLFRIRPIAAPSAKCGHCLPLWLLQVGGIWPRPTPDDLSPSARRPAEPRPAAVLVPVDAGFCRALTQVCVVHGRCAPRLDVPCRSTAAAEGTTSGKPRGARARARDAELRAEESASRPRHSLDTVIHNCFC
jgi:hypothetical protein